jgi:hypothetical protein
LVEVVDVGQAQEVEVEVDEEVEVEVDEVAVVVVVVFHTDRIPWRISPSCGRSCFLHGTLHCTEDTFVSGSCRIL